MKVETKKVSRSDAIDRAARLERAAIRQWARGEMKMVTRTGVDPKYDQGYRDALESLLGAFPVAGDRP